MGAQNEETQEGISVMEKKKRVIGIGCEKDCGNGDAEYGLRSKTGIIAGIVVFTGETMGCCSNVSFFSPLPTRPSLSHISSTITPLDAPRFPAQKTRLPSGTATTRLRCNCQLTTTDLAPLTSAAYGTLLFGGGLFAYTRSGSNGSLLGGLTGAGLMGTAYFLMQASETKELGDALAFGSALLFACVFGIRLAASRKLVPAGPLLGVSLGALAVFILAYLQDKV
nr:protein FATTY ACID EXPORT 4, chloroplastic [Ipomoea batatas]